jgi:hypothetical protein
VIAGGKFPPPPWANYQSEYIQTLPQGKLFHTITFGKGLMGSHASVLNPSERWKVILYIQKLAWADKFKATDQAAIGDTASGLINKVTTN